MSRIPPDICPRCVVADDGTRYFCEACRKPFVPMARSLTAPPRCVAHEVEWCRACMLDAIRATVE